MELHTEHNTLVTNLQTEAHVFTITASAKAYKLLSSNLYKYKIAAIIRELSCNALDSHVDAGNSNPFIVHLPSEIEPYFSVEDFGTGMTPDQIRDLYTGYFASSKTERNDQIGALGLGSKSPFAYTDMFTMESTKDGLKSTYSAFIDPEGKPTYMAVNAEATTNHSGVRITFPVPESDFYEFAQEAATIFWPFTPENRPLITGSVKRFAEQSSDYDSVAPAYEGEGWKIYKSFPKCIERKYGFRNGAMVRMGNILYPIGSLASDPAFADVEIYIKSPLIIDMPLGSCDVNPGREELSYDKLTKDNIHKQLVVIHEELEAQASTLINSMENAWLAAKEAKKYFNGILKDRDDAKIRFTYKGAAYMYGQPVEVDGDARRVSYTSSFRSRSRYSIQLARQNTGKISINLGGSSLLVLVGDKSLDSQYVRGRVKAYCDKENFGETTIYLVRTITAENLAALEGVPVVQFSDLPKPNYQKSVKAAAGNVLKFGSNAEVSFADIKGKKNIYIVDYKRAHSIDGNFADPKAMLLPKKDENVFRAMKYFTAVDPTFADNLYIVPAKLFTSLKLGASKSWKSLEQAVKDQILPLYTKNLPIAKSLTGEEALLRFYGNLLGVQTFNDSTLFAAASPFRKTLVELVILKSNYKNNQAAVEAADQLVIRIKEGVSRLNMPSAFLPVFTQAPVVDPFKVYETYPLLATYFGEGQTYFGDLFDRTFHVSPSTSRGDVDAQHPNRINSFIDYIKMVDKVNGII